MVIGSNLRTVRALGRTRGVSYSFLAKVALESRASWPETKAEYVFVFRHLFVLNVTWNVNLLYGLAPEKVL